MKVTVTPKQALTVVRATLLDKPDQWIADATGLSVRVVGQVAEQYGAPDKAKLEWARDELDAKVTAATTAQGHPPAGPRLAPVAVLEPEQSTGAVDALLADGRASGKARTRQLTERIQGMLDDLRGRLDTEHAETEEKRRRDAERQAALDEVKAAEAALEQARKKLRKYKNHPGGNAPAAVHRSTTPAAQAARSRAGAATEGRHDYDVKEVRTWARENGVDCPARGRYLPRDVVDQWRAATQRGAA